MGQDELRAAGGAWPSVSLGGDACRRTGRCKSAAPLHRRVTLALDQVPLDEALQAVIAQAGLEIAYSGRVVPLTRRVSLHAREITVAAALTEVLLDAGVDVAVTRAGQLSLVPRRSLPPTIPTLIDTTVIKGQVTEKASGVPISGATVSVIGENLSAVTGTDGRFQLTGLAAGKHAIQVRLIGYSPVERAVVVRGEARPPLVEDFALTRAIPQMDQLVVTGTVIPTEERALPTPITVVTGAEIRAQRLTRIDQIFRGTVPGSVAWDMGSKDFTSSINSRGATSFGDNTIKTYIDGVEVADPSFIANLDPNSIDRVEVIRGPQASTVYGSGAISGVMQIFTRRGGGSLMRPQIEASAALGGVQSDYADGLATRQDYNLMVSGGGSEVGYHFGGSYRGVGAWLPSYYSHDGAFNGGLHFSQGALSL